MMEVFHIYIVNIVHYLVAIKRKEKFESVVIEYLDSSIQQRHCHKILIRAVFDAKDLV